MSFFAQTGRYLHSGVNTNFGSFVENSIKVLGPDLVDLCKPQELNPEGSVMYNVIFILSKDFYGSSFFHNKLKNINAAIQHISASTCISDATKRIKKLICCFQKT